LINGTTTDNVSTLLTKGHRAWLQGDGIPMSGTCGPPDFRFRELPWLFAFPEWVANRSIDMVEVNRTYEKSLKTGPDVENPTPGLQILQWQASENGPISPVYLETLR
jgi:hypothetical protein